MEIELRTKHALFTGFHLGLDDKGPTGIMMPEVDRCFGRSGVSCSSSMITSFNNGDLAGCQGVARAAALSRAYEFAGLSPTISTKFFRYYHSLNAKTEVNRELQMRLYGEERDIDESEIVAEIEVVNGAAMSFDNSEMERFDAVGYPCSAAELSTFSLHTWEYSMLTDWEGFKASLPESWRTK